MICPLCQNMTRVTNSRSTNQGRMIRRRRICLACGHRFTTYERFELLGLEVIKRNGAKEPYYRYKLEGGLRKALEKRPVNEEQFQKLVALIENDIFCLKSKTISSEQIGRIVLSRLKPFDPVAYLRFISVYRRFRTPQSFEREIRRLGKSFSCAIHV